MTETIERVEPQEPLAYKQTEAAKLIGISLRSLCRRIKGGLITPTPLDRTITREELLRYLREQGMCRTAAPAARAKNRVPRSQYKPVYA